MDYFRREAVKKMKATLAARKNDAGCTCHGLPLLQCPNYKPAPRELVRVQRLRRNF